MDHNQNNYAKDSSLQKELRIMCLMTKTKFFMKMGVT